MILAVLRRKLKVAAESVPDIIAIEHIRRATVVIKESFQVLCNRGLPGGGKACEPHRCTFVTVEFLAVFSCDITIKPGKVVFCQGFCLHPCSPLICMNLSPIAGTSITAFSRFCPQALHGLVLKCSCGRVPQPPAALQHP